MKNLGFLRLELGLSSYISTRDRIELDKTGKTELEIDSDSLIG